MSFQVKHLPLHKDAPESQRARLESDLTLIVNRCLDSFSDVRAIVLYGGYGRQEGSWIQRPINVSIQ